MNGLADSYYSYGITDFKVNPENEEIIDIYCGNGKMPLHIYKKEIPYFLMSVIPKEEVEKRQLTVEGINKNVEQYGLDLLKYLLVGRGIILVTDFHNHFEYNNGGQNGIKLITCLNMDGEIELKRAYQFALMQPTFDELYPNSGKKVN